MAKTSRTLTSRPARHSPLMRTAVPLRPRDLASRRQPSTRARATPAEFFVRSLLKYAPAFDPHIAGFGGEVECVVRLHVEVIEGEAEGIFVDPSTYNLVVRFEMPLPTGGTHTAKLDSWCGIDFDAPDAPLWAGRVRAAPTRPLLLRHSLGWLWTNIQAIDHRAARCDGDVWCRILRFLNCVKEAYRPTPPRPSPIRPRPRPRGRDTELRTGLEGIVQELAVLHLDSGVEDLADRMEAVKI
ncbi:hypothetical protein OH76DRAFT_1487088 [Lentinus brumalis]|uniref:Uncharacterized protein n=1 Tax=Lentinus brumalis TaxID=2498619 RepID=A0A371CW59_9APHY|nr:hypothetical protein OH76DRAFT_1487088 [Polyporus brumalis]